MQRVEQKVHSHRMLKMPTIKQYRTTAEILRFLMLLCDRLKYYLDYLLKTEFIEYIEKNERGNQA